jgi:shikimate kinase
LNIARHPKDREIISAFVKDAQFLILIGPAGAGKTWIGHVLARRLGITFLDAERMFLARYGSTEAFLRNKPEALDWFEQVVRESVGMRTVVFEAGPFSQQDLVRRLQEEFSTVLVSVGAPLAVRLERIRGREQGRHFVYDPEASVRYDDLYEREVKPKFSFSFHVENAGLSEDEVAEIVQRELARLGIRPVGS